MLQDLLKNRKPIYETITESIVWDDTWIHWLDQPAATRALYIGDSISRGVRVVGNGMFGTKLFFDTFSTSKSLDNPYFFPTLKMFADQQPHREAVLFNNGLHGWHLTEEEYGELYDAFVDELICEYGQDKIYLVLTTYSASEHYPNDRVIARNEIALFFYQIPDRTHETRVSIRTRDPWDATQLATRFGGGGHLRAAGCTIKGAMGVAKRQMRRAVREMLKG